MCRDETIISRFQGIVPGLVKNPNNEFFNHGFLVMCENNLVGYIGIGEFNLEEKSVYLRAAIDREQRGKAYGKILLEEITCYIFSNFDIVENIRLKIALDNKPSLNTARSCGYEWLEKDLFIKYNPNIKRSL